nr:hypothetical protein [Tanacetum cinerariifolium]
AVVRVKPRWDGVGWGGDVVDIMLVGDEGDVDGWMVVDLVAGGLAGKIWAAPEMVYSGGGEGEAMVGWCRLGWRCGGYDVGL